MKELVEFIGKIAGYSIIDIYNQYSSIDNNISKLIYAEVKLETDKIILIAIEYSLNLKLQMKYKSIINYVQEII